jgi:hypothetical protein
MDLPSFSLSEIFALGGHYEWRLKQQEICFRGSGRFQNLLSCRIPVSDEQIAQLKAAAAQIYRSCLIQEDRQKLRMIAVANACDRRFQTPKPHLNKLFSHQRSLLAPPKRLLLAPASLRQSKTTRNSHFHRRIYESLKGETLI